MATNMAELMALLKGPNRVSSSFTPPPGYERAVDPSPWAKPTLIPANGDTFAPMIVNAPAAHPVNNLPAPPSFSHPANLPAVTPITSATMLELPMLVPPSISTPVPVSVSASIPAPTSAVPPPIIFLPTTAQAPTHTAEPPPYQAPQPHIGLSYQAPPLINIAYSKPGTLSHAAPRAPPTNFLPETGTEQEQRLKKLEENIRALQSSGSRLDAGDGDWSLFPGAALDWYMSLKVADIPTWADLSSKFIDQYKYCAETPPTLLELSTMEMTEDQGFEAYAVKWRARAAKHAPPIGEAQQIQLFHSTLKGAYYLHLLAHTSSFSNLIDAGKKLDIGVKLGKIEGPAEKKEGKSSKRAATRTARSRRGKDTPPASRTPQPVQRAPTPQDQQGIATQTRRKQLTPLPAPLSHIYRQFLAGEYETEQEAPAPFVIEYVPAETGVGYAGFDATPAPFVIEVPVREPYQDSKVPWTYEGSVGNLERQFSIMGVTRSGRVYENLEAANKGKAPAAALGIALEYKVVEQIAKSPAHISLLALLLNSEAHREALLRVLIAAQIPKETAPERIEETIGSIFSNNISFSDDELPSEGWAYSRALHIVCKCNNFIIGRVMIENGSALNVCPVSTLKQMNVDFNLIRPSKTTVRAFDGSRREVNGEIDLVIEDYAIYKETSVPYVSIGDDENLPFHSFETISVIRDYGEIDPTRADRMIGKVLLRNNYIPGTGLGAHGQEISRPIEIEEYNNKRGLGFRPSCHEIIEARRGKHLHCLAARYRKINRGILVHPLSYFFPRPPHIVGGTLDGPSSDSDSEPVDLPTIHRHRGDYSRGLHPPRAGK
ncbi:hypothetical protein CRG98_007430 [Punica granatum]|uniref:G-patch domain-containing protein n=1 Tax=Punica granatum TaxID=22663 RepID=A0A2I0KUL9_PUNGR|nr:hypothetical protein CRG98_007430 [Punica granatum]